MHMIFNTNSDTDMLMFTYINDKSQSLRVISEQSCH